MKQTSKMGTVWGQKLWAMQEQFKTQAFEKTLLGWRPSLCFFRQNETLHSVQKHLLSNLPLNLRGSWHSIKHVFGPRRSIPGANMETCKQSHSDRRKSVLVVLVAFLLEAVAGGKAF